MKIPKRKYLRVFCHISLKKKKRFFFLALNCSKRIALKYFEIVFFDSKLFPYYLTSSIWGGELFFGQSPAIAPAFRGGKESSAYRSDKNVDPALYDSVATCHLFFDKSLQTLFKLCDNLFSKVEKSGEGHQTVKIGPN